MRLPSSQNYGVLMQGGHVVFRPFTFTANGTNNQLISVVFQLQDGPRNLQTVVFSFILGHHHHRLLQSRFDFRSRH